MTSKPVLYSIDRTSDSSDSEEDALLIATVNVGNGRTGQIFVHSFDGAAEACRVFCAEHRLPDVVYGPLFARVNAALASLNPETPVVRRTPVQHYIPTADSAYRMRPSSAKPRNVPTYERLYSLARRGTPQKQRPPPSQPRHVISAEQGQRLYQQGVRNREILEKKHEAIRQQRELEEASSIYQAKQMPAQYVQEKSKSFMERWQQRNKILEKKREAVQEARLQECTFSPVIDKNSSWIDMKNSRDSASARFMKLYENAKEREARIAQKCNVLMSAVCPFNPDTRVTDSVNSQLVERMKERSVSRSVSHFQEEEEEQSKHWFQPKIGRPPKNRPNKPHEIGEFLYAAALKSPSIHTDSVGTTPPKPNPMMDQLKLKKFRSLFEMLKPVHGFIDKHSVEQAELPVPVRNILKPLLEEICEMEERLSFEEFFDSLQLLLKMLSPAEKSELLMTKKVAAPAPEYSFKPAVRRVPVKLDKTLLTPEEPGPKIAEFKCKPLS